MDKESSRRSPLVLSGRGGKRSLDAYREWGKSPRVFFFSFSLFSCTPGNPEVAAAAETTPAMGVYRCPKFWGRRTIISDQNSSVPRRCGESPLLFFSLFPPTAWSQTWVQLWEVHSTASQPKAHLSGVRDWKVSPREEKGMGKCWRGYSLGKQPHKIVYECISSVFSCAYVNLTLNNITMILRTELWDGTLPRSQIGHWVAHTCDKVE